MLEAAEERDLEQIADLEEWQQATEERRTQLEAAAEKHRERIEELGGPPQEEP